MQPAAQPQISPPEYGMSVEESFWEEEAKNLLFKIGKTFAQGKKCFKIQSVWETNKGN